MRAKARWLAGVVAPLILMLPPEPAIAGGSSCVREEYVHEWIGVLRASFVIG